MNAQKYSFIRALRPFSFSVALIACGVGIVAASNQGLWDLMRVCLVMFGGVLMQAGVNLINDHADKELWLQCDIETYPDRAVVLQLIQRNYYVGLGCGFLAVIIGLWLVALTNIGLFILCLAGLFGGYYYTAEPINYKRRGLGVILVFWFTGVLMVCGAYYSLASELHLDVIFLSLPVAVLSSLLLLSNELRDVHEDREQGFCTLTVRLGERVARAVYVGLLLICYGICWWLGHVGLIAQVFWLLPSVLFACWLIYRVIHATGVNHQLPPLTGRFFMIFGIGYLYSLYLAG